MIMVVEVRSGPPLPLVKICGTSNICRPPIMEVIITYTRMGRISGMVIFQNIWFGVQPSSSAASYRVGSTPIMAAISMMVVLPNHIRKFIRPTSARLPHTVFRKLMGSVVQPMLMSTAFTGPLSENRAKKSMAKAEAMMRFGI